MKDKFPKWLRDARKKVEAMIPEHIRARVRSGTVRCEYNTLGGGVGGYGYTTNRNKSKLAGTRTYLAGPMDRVADGGAGWRDKITPSLQALGVIVIDPRFKPIDMGKEDAEKRRIRHEEKAKGNWAAMEADKDIRTVDLRCVDVSDFLIARIDMSAKPFGTIEEITLANRQKKPIICFCEGGKSEAPDWLFWVIGHKFIFNSMEEVLDYLGKVARGEETDKRWVIFDWTPLIEATERVYGKF